MLVDSFEDTHTETHNHTHVNTHASCTHIHHVQGPQPAPSIGTTPSAAPRLDICIDDEFEEEELNASAASAAQQQVWKEVMPFINKVCRDTNY